MNVIELYDGTPVPNALNYHLRVIGEVAYYNDAAHAVVTIESSCTIKVIGHVRLKQLLINTNEPVTITGDILTVENPSHGIAIGTDADWGKSYGRYCFTDIVPDITIDCREIHAHSKTNGCGIGAYCVRAIELKDFTEKCIVRDTPIDFQIYNEPLSGSTKHSELPVYMSSIEYKKWKKESADKACSKLLTNKTIPDLVELFSREVQIIAKDEKTLKDASTSTFDAVVKFVDKLTVVTYVAGLQRIFGSLMKAIIDAEMFYPCQLRSEALVVSLVCLAKECRLFREIPSMPLAMRYCLIVFDATDNDYVETVRENEMSSFEELDLDDALLKLYHHPTDMDYSKECKRSFYGESIYFNNDTDNDTVSSCIHKDSDNISTTTGLSLLPRCKWFLSRIPVIYKGYGSIAAFVTVKDNEHLLLHRCILGEEASDVKDNQVVLCTFPDIAERLLGLFAN